MKDNIGRFWRVTSVEVTYPDGSHATERRVAAFDTKGRLLASSPAIETLGLHHSRRRHGGKQCEGRLFLYGKDSAICGKCAAVVH